MPTRYIVLTVTAACLLAVNSPAAESNTEETRKLVAILQSNAPLFDKARACQQLGEFGGPEAVPALAALLADEHLSAYARSGLEGIPNPSAAEALRNAVPTLKGSCLAGVVNSLGVLRDAQAVGLLKKLAEDPASGVASEALLALGRIATDESIEILRQALASGPETIRAQAAAGGLHAAEKQLAEGRTDKAVALYDAVRNASVPLQIRAAATRGAIVARKAEGVALLVEQLRSNERHLRNVALMAVREIPCDALAGALNAEVGRASAALRIQLLMALVDCHNTESLQVLRNQAAGEDPEVRKTALTVLGRIGGTTEVAVLLQAATGGRSAEESEVALSSLRQMEGAAIDGQIAKALVSAGDAGSRIKLIRLVESRGQTNAMGVLLEQAAGPDPAVSVAALRAMKSLAGAAQLPALIALAKSCKDDAVRAAAGSAVVGVCARTGSAALGNDAVLAELKQAGDPALKCSWITILAALGDARALPTLVAAINDANSSVAVTAIEQLGHWPDPAPVDALLEVALRGTNAPQRNGAFASALRLLTIAAEERQRPVETLVKWFHRANDATRTPEEQRQVISFLGRVPHTGSMDLLVRYLDDPLVKNEAAAALVQIAPALRPGDPAALREALEKIAATVKNPDVLSRAAKIAATLPSQSKRTALFDGLTLAGWDGSTSVWRVRDGVIVGGSLEGNPRNEFLATVRSCTNFVLRLEYKLVGTEGFVNGGVQIHSVRVKQPPNEMSGFQADIGAGYSGSLYDESRRNKLLARADEAQVKRLEKPGDWNRYEVRCAGPRIQITLNGEKTVDYTEADPAIPLDGLIALQIHGACKAEISFRNLAIEDISYGLATRELGLAKTRWKVLSFSSENTQAEDERAVLAIDGNPDTFWHTLWNGGKPGHPHHLAVDLGEEAEISGFAYLPRQDGRHVRGVIGDYAFHVSRDGTDWGQPVAQGRFERIDLDASGRVVLLPRPVTGRYFKLVSLSAPGGEPYAGAAEIDVLGKPARK